MRTLLIVIGLLAICNVAAAQGRGGSRPQGAVLVQRFCAGCHAVGASGDSPNPAAPRFRELHRRYSIDSLAEALAEGMLVGHPAMPEFDFEPDDVKAIVTYLKSIQTNQEAALAHRAAP